MSIPYYIIHIKFELKILLKRKHIFSYNCYKYIILDYDLNLERGKP